MGEILPSGGQVSIEYPYKPERGEIKYVPADNIYIRIARDFARHNSLDKAMPNASVVVKDGKVIGMGANGSDFHENNVCERVRLGIPTGQGYELCEGCHPKNHSEPKAVADAKELFALDSLEGAEVYLWGHWWCCEPCWNTMLESGINTVNLLESSQVLFNRETPGNIIGRQFEES